MKVLGVTPLYPPNSRVGAWLSTHECFVDLVRHGHDVEVMTTLSDQIYELDGVQVIGRASRLRATARQHDVVVSHLGDRSEGHNAAVSTDRPSVRMVHGDPTGANLTGSALVVFNSVASKEVAGWDGESIVVHPPVDLNQHRTSPGSAVTLINLTREKGVDLFYEIADRTPDRQFLGVKGGYGRQRRRDRPNVELIDTQHDMRGVWSRTRVLLMPSDRESFGRVGLEAMSSGIPVLAHPTPGLIESLGGAATFIDRCDIAAWVRHIRRLEDPAEWHSASARARQHANSFDREAHLTTFRTAIEGLVGVSA